jgi:hypothetical protein
MANNFRGNDALGKMNFLENVIRDIVIRGTVIRANDFRGTDPYPIVLYKNSSYLQSKYNLLYISLN